MLSSSLTIICDCVERCMGFAGQVSLRITSTSSSTVELQNAT
jgi:hypothetical protein